MAEKNHDQQTDDLSVITRRRLLKGAAAAGVGVAAWSAPNISTLGFAPAYAYVCTVGTTSYSLGKRNTNCNCNHSTGGTPAKSARYKELGSACVAGPAFPGTAVMVEGQCGGTPIDDAGNCPFDYETSNGDIGEAGVCVTPTDQDLFCQTEVRVYQGGSCGGPYDAYFGAVAQGAAFLDLPPIGCTGGGNIFMEVFVTCSTDQYCLDGV